MTITWSQEEIDAFDVRAQKLISTHRGFQPKSSSLRLESHYIELNDEDAMMIGHGSHGLMGTEGYF